MGINDISDSLNLMSGQDSFSSEASQGNKILYLARVDSVDDRSDMGRITATIVDFNDSNGEEQPGKDRYDTSSKVAFPLIPHFFNIQPRVGELVYLFLENPKDQSSRRFYVGPIRSVKKRVSEKESTSSANKMFTIDSYQDNDTVNAILNDRRFGENNDNVFVRGKNDSEVSLRPREVMITAGYFQDGTYNKNEQTTCFIQLKDYKEVLRDNGEIERESFSQTNIVGSNINLISSNNSSKKERSLDENGNIDPSNFESSTNPDLETYGETAKKLHPLVFGDELVKLLKIMIRFCLNHKHTPQDKPYGTVEEINLLKEYLGVDSNSEDLDSAQDINSKMTELLSKSVRTN
jgi:hypothetical protein